MSSRGGEWPESFWAKTLDDLRLLYYASLVSELRPAVMQSWSRVTALRASDIHIHWTKLLQQLTYLVALSIVNRQASVAGRK